MVLARVLKCVLLFLGVNQRDTRRPERPWIYLYVCLQHALLHCVLICTYLEDKVFVFHVPLLWVAIFVMQKFETISYWLADQPTTAPFGNWLTNQKFHQHLLSNSICVSFHCGIKGCQWDWCSDPQSHCALPLLLPVNQSEPSVFVMVEDNQFQNKKKGRERAGQWGGQSGGQKNKIKGKEALWVETSCSARLPNDDPTTLSLQHIHLSSH